MAAPWVRATAAWTTTYQRSWKSSLFSSFLSPILFLAAMGKGLGSLVDDGGTLSIGGLGSGVDYVSFLAPGLLATATLTIAAQEAMWPVNAAVRWTRTYHAMAATPLAPSSVLAGHLAYMTYRALSVAAVFVLVMTVFGAVESPFVVFAIPAAALTGMAMAAPMAAYAVTLTVDGGFAAANRFLIVPMMLFAGAFFPISQLPDWVRPLAYVTPTWHGVDMCRSLAFGDIDGPRLLGHVAFLGALVVIGAAVAARNYRRVLTP